MQKRLKIVVGTRPEAIKLLPVFLEISKVPVFETTLVSTGQHKEMLEPVFDLFQVWPDIDLNLMTHNQSLSQFTSRAIDRLEQYLQSSPTDLLIVQGDTTTAMVTSLVGYYNRIKTAHVEAGLRTFNRFSPFPEEVNRRMIGLLADFHFAPTQRAADNLRSENIDNIWITGNTVIDSLLYCRKHVESRREIYQSKFSGKVKSNQQNVLVTGHRRESLDGGFTRICKAINALAKEYQAYNFIYPVHLNPNVRKEVMPLLSDKENIFLIEPVNYDDMIYLMIHSKVILTDSGGIQEEAPTLNIPVIVMRDTTERQEGIDAGCSVLAGTTTEGILENFRKVMNEREVYLKMASTSNPYGLGDASQKIASILAESFS